jgi:hypothetical protein
LPEEPEKPRRSTLDRTCHDRQENPEHDPAFHKPDQRLANRSFERKWRNRVKEVLMTENKQTFADEFAGVNDDDHAEDLTLDEYVTHLRGSR